MLISASDIITKSIDLYKKNWKLFLKYAFLYFVLVFIPLLLQTFFLPETKDKFEQISVFSVEVMGYFAIGLVGFVILLWALAAFVQAIARRYKEKEHHSFLNQFEEASKILLPLIFVSILTKILIGISTLALIIPGLIVSIWLFFASYEVILSGKSGWSAIKGSKKLVTHRWWRVFWRIVAPQLYFVIFLVIAQMIFQFLFTLIVGNEFIVSVLISLLVMLFLPLLISSIVILYIELKRNPVEDPKPHPDPDKIN